MAAIVTTNCRIYAASQFEDSFATSGEYMYLFIAGTLPWVDDNSPPSPIDCELNLSTAYRNMLSLKNITANNVSLAIPRNTWVVNTTYSQYDNTIDLFDPASPNPPFYVTNTNLQVYKCLNNNNGVPSTVQPSGTSTSVVTSADGYQWKYMYTVNSADVVSFVTTNWIPVSTLASNDGSSQWQVQTAAVPGTVDRINIVTAGTSYTQVPTITITGDGTGATATATIAGGNVTGINMTATGSGYTYANVAITNGGVSSNGATATATISPFGGHGSDPVTELGGFNVLVDVQLIYDENGNFTVSNDYRVLGLLSNPILNDGSGDPATATDYDQAVRLNFSSVSGTIFNPDEIVTGSTSGATGVVLDWTPTTVVPDGPAAKTLRLVQCLGTFIPGETVIGADATGVLSTYAATASSGTGTTIVFPAGASSVNSFYNGQTIKITAGTGSGQTRLISAYVGISRTATVSTTWTTPPDNTSVFTIASIIKPDILPYSGKILYLENRRPVERASDQIEDSKILIQF
jgi:hypothetical protein